MEGRAGEVVVVEGAEQRAFDHEQRVRGAVGVVAEHECGVLRVVRRVENRGAQMPRMPVGVRANVYSAVRDDVVVDLVQMQRLARKFHLLVNGASRDSKKPAEAMFDAPGAPLDATTVLTAG